MLHITLHCIVLRYALLMPEMIFLLSKIIFLLTLMKTDSYQRINVIKAIYIVV